MNATISTSFGADFVSVTSSDVPSVDTTAIYADWSRLRSELLGMRRYEADWDGADAFAPDPLLIDSAIEFLRLSRQQAPQSPPTGVALSPDTSVIFSWRNKSDYSEAEISKPGFAEWMRKRSDSKTFEHWVQRWDNAGEREPDCNMNDQSGGDALASVSLT